MTLGTDWAREFIAELVTLKARGYPFGWGWELALERHPPPARELRADEGLEYMRKITSDAWHGHNPVLAQLPSILALAFEPTDSGTARKKTARSLVA